jgi:hypothetical protein
MRINLETDQTMNREQMKASAMAEALRQGGRVLFLASATIAILAACNTDRLLDVKALDRVDAGLYDDPKQAALMVNSTVADFECAYASAALVEGIISDEFADAQLGAAGWPYDRRDANVQTGGIYGTNSCNNNQNPGLYLPLSTARFDADQAVTKLTAWTDAQVSNRGKLLATAALYAGFSYALMGMSMCEAAFDLGPQIDQQAMFALADQRFSTAITEGGKSGQTAIVNAAYVGRARVRLFMNKLAEAAADAAQVPAGFTFNATYDANNTRRYNRIYASLGQNGLYTVETQSRDLRTEGVPDPRAAVTKSATRAADATTPIYNPDKYPGYASPMRIASYDEAQLIRAEALGGSQAVNIINALRDAVSLPHYTGATDAASIKTLIINERQRALFAEGFRNYDIQRFAIPFNPPVGATFPLKGGQYGNTTCLPLPDIERFNNPNIHS